MPGNCTFSLAQWVELPPNLDPRGRLTEIDFRRLPFVPVRAFLIDQVPEGTLRGRHAHRDGSQLLICISGQVEVELRYYGQCETVLCKPGQQGLLISPGVWAQQRYLTDDSKLLVLSSLPYEEVVYLDSEDAGD